MAVLCLCIKRKDMSVVVAIVAVVSVGKVTLCNCHVAQACNAKPCHSSMGVSTVASCSMVEYSG